MRALRPVEIRNSGYRLKLRITNPVKAGVEDNLKLVNFTRKSLKSYMLDTGKTECLLRHEQMTILAWLRPCIVVNEGKGSKIGQSPKAE